MGTRSPGNLGAVCRIAAAFGFPSVHLVGPAVDRAHEEARWLAHGAEDVLDAVTVHDDLAAALQGCLRSAATTARARHGARPLRSPSEISETLARAGTARPYALVFGPEDRGLTNEELARCDEVLSIPLPSHGTATLSLPAAAAVVAWELSRAMEIPDGDARTPPASRAPESTDRLLDTIELDELLQGIQETLDRIGFRPRPDAARFRGALRDFLARARPTEADHRVLRHVFAQVGKWQRRLEGELVRGRRP